MSTDLTVQEMDELRQQLEAEIPSAIELRHHLHSHPATSGNEEPTAELVSKELGASDAPNIAGGRVICVGDSPRFVALRAELDALPIVEQTNVAWASSNGAMHACGHDVHLAALVAVVRMLKTAKMPVAAILQPREESVPGGAADMIKAGALRDNSISVVVGVHVQPQLELGSFSSASGVVNASSDEFDLTISGVGGHGAYPHTTKDPIVAAATTVTALQHIVSRSLDPMNPAVVGVGSIHGGSAANAIPDEVTLTGTVRCYDSSQREKMADLILSTATHAAQLHGCAVSCDYRYGEPPLNNDPELTLRQQQIASQWGLGLAPDMRSCGSDDFAFFGEQVPSLMSFVGVSDGSPNSPRLHSATFLPPDAAVRDTALLLLAGYLAGLGISR